MAPDERSAATVVEQELLAHASAYNFFQAVNMLEKMSGFRARLGEKGPFSHEAVRLRAHASLAFPRADIESLSIAPIEDSEAKMPPYLLTVNFLGLYGPASPLPTFYTEEILGKNDEENSARHFLDLFHHRLISFYYRAWLKYRYYLHFQPGAKDRFSHNLLALTGWYERSEQKTKKKSYLFPERLLPVMGMLLGRARSKEVIERVVSNYFGGVSVVVDQFEESRMVIDDTQRNRIGISNCRLADDMVLGAHVRSQTTKIGVTLGPLPYNSYMLFLPGKPAFFALRELIQYLVKDSVAYSVTLLVVTDHVPKLSLTRKSRSGLGWNAWLGRPMTEVHKVAQSGVS